MTYKFFDDFIGYPPIETPVPAPVASAPYVFPITPGTIAQVEDKVWGGGEAAYARANGAIRAFGLCVLTPVWDATGLLYIINATEVPNTANLGRALCVNQAGALTTGQYGWFLVEGVTPVDCNASVAADTAWGIVAAGQGGANTAGKQILNARVVTAATQTTIKTATGDIGSTVLNVSNTDGWFVGAFLSGTGVGAATRIVSMDPLGKFVIVSVANSAAVAGNVTQTNNNATIFYNVAVINRPFAQGAIT